MNNKPIPWWEPRTGKLESALVQEVLDSHYLNEGNSVERFEREIAERTGAKHAIACTSGTVALFLSLKACGIGPNDEVLVPDITFIATANAVKLAGATPVLVDIQESTLTLDPKNAPSHITEKTKAIIPVHVSGRAAPMKPILEMARRHGLKVIEDAAEGWSSYHRNHHLGTIGDVGCLSLSPNKTITTGQGGIILTNNDLIAEKVRALKDQGRPKRGTGGDDAHDTIGFNFKYTNLQAAIGLAQLQYLDQRTQRIKRHWEIYQNELGNHPVIRFPGFSAEETPQWIDIVTPYRNELENWLTENQMGTRRFWHPLHTQKPYKTSHDLYPISTAVSPNSLWLPSAYTLTDLDIQNVCQAIHKFQWNESEKRKAA